LLSPEEKQKNTEKNEPKCHNKLAQGAMVRVILIANMMGCVDQRMEGKRSKPYQQKDCCKLERSIFLKLNHNPL